MKFVDFELEKSLTDVKQHGNIFFIVKNPHKKQKKIDKFTNKIGWKNVENLLCRYRIVLWNTELFYINEKRTLMIIAKTLRVPKHKHL